MHATRLRHQKMSASHSHGWEHDAAPLCRVPMSKRAAQQRITADVQTGCISCASGDGRYTPQSSLKHKGSDRRLPSLARAVMHCEAECINGLSAAQLGILLGSCVLTRAVHQAWPACCIRRQCCLQKLLCCAVMPEVVMLQLQVWRAHLVEHTNGRG